MSFHLESLIHPGDLLMPRRTDIVVTPQINAALTMERVALAYSSSGGKDSGAMGLALARALPEIGFNGPQVVVHTDLGRVEHAEALEMAQRLADHLRVPLLVARREKGDLVARFLQRWQGNLTRYQALQCAKVIMPWPSSGMLFCRSEVKTSPACRALVQAFPNHTIINAVGIRAEESAARAKQPISKVQPLLTSKTLGTQGFNWNPIHHWTLADVLDIHKREGFPLAERYTRWNAERFSCRFCVLGSAHDWQATIANPESHEHYRELCDLEIKSAFGMMERRWLIDLAPELLTAETREQIEVAKAKATARTTAEARLPQSVIFDKQGWPISMPTLDEAGVLAEVRAEVAELYGFEPTYTSAQAVYDRFAELVAQKEQKHAK